MDIVNIMLGNICSILAMGTDAISSSRKTINGMLWVQNISQLIYGISSLFLKGYSATVQNVVCIIRNLAVIKGVKSKVAEWTLLTLAVVIGLYFNNLGIMGLLPIIANLQYTLAVFRFKDNQRIIKFSFLIHSVLFAFFSLAVLNFVGVCTNLVVAGSTVIFLIKTKKVKKKQS